MKFLAVRTRNTSRPSEAFARDRSYVGAEDLKRVSPAHELKLPKARAEKLIVKLDAGYALKGSVGLHKAGLSGGGGGGRGAWVRPAVARQSYL